MLRIRAFVTILLAGFLLFTGNLQSTRAQDEIEDVSLLLTFIPNIQFAPFYLAIENGDFADNGYRLVAEYLDEPIVVDLIATNPRAVGVISGEQLIISRAGGRGVVFTYAWFQEYPVGIVVAENSDIESIADLRGRKVGIPGRFGASYTGLTALLLANGMTESDIQLEEIGFNAPEVFCVGAVEASVIYVNNEPLQIGSRAAAGDCGEVTGVRVLPVGDALNLVSNGLVFNEEILSSDSDFVTGFVNAFHQGLVDAINNPAAAYLASAPYIETLPFTPEIEAVLTEYAQAQAEFLATNPDAAAIAESRPAMRETLAASLPADALLQFDVLLLTITLWEAEQLGYSDPQAWINMQDTLLALQLLSEPIDLEAAYTNAFVPSVDD